MLATEAMFKSEHKAVGEFNWRWAFCLVIHLHDGMPPPDNEDARFAYSALPGRYWRVGSLHGMPCFKQEPPPHKESTNIHELWYYLCDEE